MGYVNYQSIRTKISKSKKLIDDTENIVKKRFEDQKDLYIQAFDSHKITQEIQDGPTASNSSGTLGGVGNLFSFIGFDKSDNPIETVKNYISSHFKLSKPKITSKGGKIRLDFTVEYPSIDDLKKSTPMPWEGGRSWISSIEKGISGFSNYVYKRFVEGRSGEALQSDTKLRSGSYKPVSYMSEIISKFKKGMNK
jgi:hypothetical protein